MKEIKDVNEQKDTLFSCIGRFNIVKTVISKLVYRFNVISIESEKKKNRKNLCRHRQAYSKIYITKN